METVVLVKQVPSTDIDRIPFDENMEFKTNDMVMNPYCEIALEEALRIRETHGGSVTVVSVGNQKAEDVVRRGIALGADHGILIMADRSDQLRLAKILAGELKQIRFDLILAGDRSIDEDSSIVGPALADMLDIPSITQVTGIKILDSSIQCIRSVEQGTITVEASLPVLCTATRGLNEPRCVLLKGMIKSKKANIEVRKAHGIPGSKTKTLFLKHRPEREPGRIIEGDSASEKAGELVRALTIEAKVIKI
ncbi:MAG: electron transfer flavoprotein subunit beta/FixA family protein [Desulfobacteraceae bacterium]|nr:electron transfer flavoprotein subunit beta/FixA family protein [Desulfobacteraceae bacterium]